MQGEKRGVVYAVRAEELNRRELGQPVQLSSAREAEKRWRFSSADKSSVMAAVTISLEHV
jgi:hypothetical protein